MSGFGVDCVHIQVVVIYFNNARFYYHAVFYEAIEVCPNRFHNLTFIQHMLNVLFIMRTVITFLGFFNFPVVQPVVCMNCVTE